MNDKQESIEDIIKKIPKNLDKIISDMDYTNQLQLISFSNTLIHLGTDISTRIIIDEIIKSNKFNEKKDLGGIKYGKYKHI